ncbi:MAG: polysaccharide deacetylase family protein [Clostridia bacterium]|nr:polysaccharide deacetylase family protein [Clostridia bacterium]
MSNKKVIIKRVILTAIIMFMGASICLITYDRATVNNKYGINEKSLEIPIFVYHDIVKEQSEIQYDYMQTTAETFEKQIVGLKKAGYDFITYEDLENYSENKKRINKLSCIITFDDGWEGVYENAFPVIKKYNVPITIYLITDYMETPGYLTWDEAKEMQNSGLVTIASHSIDHAEFTNLSTEDAVSNVNKSYEIIEEKLGKQETKIFTYPYGIYTDEQIEALKNEGYIQNLTDNKINKSKSLDMARLHRCYPLSDSIVKMISKIIYRSIRYN